MSEPTAKRKKPERPCTDQQRLWLFLYARRAFHHVESVCQYIINSGLDSSSEIYYPLFIAKATLYARPFMNNFGVGRLDEKLVPREHLDLHKGILDMRSKFAAHTDATTIAGPELPSNEVRFVRTRTEFGPCTTEVKATLCSFENTLPLVQELQKKCFYHSNKLINRHVLDTPKNPGEYLLDLQDSPATFYTKTETQLGDRFETLPLFRPPPSH